MGSGMPPSPKNDKQIKKKSGLGARGPWGPRAPYWPLVAVANTSNNPMRWLIRCIRAGPADASRQYINTACARINVTPLNCHTGLDPGRINAIRAPWGPGHWALAGRPDF